MKKNYLLLMAMLLFAVVGFTSCSDDDEQLSEEAQLLVGTWEGRYDIMTFNANGTGYSEALDYDHEYSFTWRLEGERLSIIDDGEAEIYIIEYLDENTLEMSFDYGDGDIEYYTYERVE